MIISTNKASDIRINEQINSSQIRLIDHEGNMIGVVLPKQGLELARRVGLDLVEISPNAEPPVCKVMDFGKYKYEIQKKAQEAKKKQKVVEIKEIKIRPNIAEGDYGVKLRNARKFIAEGNKVRVSLQFKGREITHNELGFAVIQKFKADMSDVAKVELEPKLEGKQIFLVIIPN
ncbi:Translation initiation factor IF-3 [Candidatus Jidaibacter acanthamoeba]|uniref:Translation initiation factor IF-3 n=1 Tax=Candidatus Jidaibacter acanthamoebae TaxID=86105 RepID=A0A0C1QX80_9RICK|nr:Translation initiation factor IF-3 [Candidatus Jidaibacter acanthamoeba]